MARESEDDPAAWLSTVFPETFTQDSFAPHHLDYYRWVWSVRAGVRPRPMVIPWGRHGGKSTAVEATFPIFAARRSRRYGFYISATQAQADDHLVTISEHFSSPEFSAAYPTLGTPRIQVVGGSSGRQLAWRRNRLWTSEGYVVDALGIDTAVRGRKLGRRRPDHMIFDDIDDTADVRGKGEKLAKKIKAISRRILPAGSNDCAVVFAQNLIYRGSIMSALSNVQGATANIDFLVDREIIGPIPAIENLVYKVLENPRRYKITGGRPTWHMLGYAECEAHMMTDGLEGWLVETQHELDIFEGPTYKGVEFRSVRPEEIPALNRVVVWVDPAVTSTVHSDSQGIQCDAMGEDGNIYRLESWEGITDPLSALVQAIGIAVRHGSETVSIETDQGGDLWRSTFAEARRAYSEGAGVPIDSVPRFGPPAKGGASRSDGGGAKQERQLRMRAGYTAGNIIHISGRCDLLEKALKRHPAAPDDLSDAAYWSWWELRNRPAAVMSGADPR